MKFQGVMPAIITPIDKNGKLNVVELEKMLERFIAEGADGFYVLGGTGEGILVSKELHMEMTRETLRIVNHRVPCIVHVARINNDEMIELAKYAESLGADALSAIPPIYYRYSEDDIYKYFKDVCDAVKIPLLIYNNANIGVSFSDALFERLFSIPNLTGIKWTNPNYLQVIALRDKHPELNIINGPDELLLLGLSAGCDAGIGTTYNFMVPTYRKIYDNFKAGNYEEAYKYQTLATKIILAIAPYNALRATKFLLSVQGLDVNYNFNPSTEYTEDEKTAILAAARAAGLEI